MRFPLPFLLLMAMAVHSAAEPLQIAVASSFRPTLERLLQRYETNTGTQGVVISGATGLLYAQIINGAQFDILLAADNWRPRQLVDTGYGKSPDLQIYALGKLVLAGPAGTLDEDSKAENVFSLLETNRRPLAIANPDTAPYGAAARQALKAMALWDATATNRVMGQNAVQAFQFYATGNAAYAFTSQAQFQRWRGAAEGSQWRVPQRLYQALEHTALVLDTVNSVEARRFLAFVTSPTGRDLIRQDGYGVPSNS